jgi:L-iditol 2-dehydrogenase
VKAVVAGAPGCAEWIEVDEPALEPGSVILQPLACGICSTDVKQVRAGYQGGPRYVLGHELVGEVIATGKDAPWRPGDRVAAMPYLPCGVCAYCQAGQPTLCPHLFEVTLQPGGLAEKVLVPGELARRGLFPLPAALPLAAAALAEPLGCCVQAVEACGLQPGMPVLVVGDGPMGLMNAIVARAYGAQPILIAGLTPQRLAIAREHYADRVIDASMGDLGTAVREETGGRGADVVIVAVSSAEAAQAGIEGLRPGGVLNAFAGVPQGTTLPLDLRRLHYEQWHLTGSFGLAPAHLERALELLANGQAKVEPLITATFAFEEIPAAMDYALRMQGLKAVVLF